MIRKQDPDRFRRRLLGVWVCFVGTLGALVLAGPLPGCGYEDTDFTCGVRLGSNPTVTRSCDGLNEVCMCWTHACAVLQSPAHVPTEKNYCPSGYRYREKGTLAPPSVTLDAGADAMVYTTPTVPIDDDLGACVPPELVEWKVAGNELCEDSEFAPSVLGRDPDANSSSSSSSSGAEAGAGGQGGSGGGAGQGGTSAMGGAAGMGGTP
jgi:uncharacterized membrane protein YgcG